MKKNKLFTLFSLTLLSMGTPLTSIAQVIAVSQDTPVITTVVNEETENTQDQETKPETTDEDKADKDEAELVTTEQEKSDKKETSTPSDKKAKAETPAETLLWGDAPYTFDSDTGILTVNSGTLDKPENAPWKLTDNRKVDANKIKKISFTGVTTAPKNANSLFKDLSNLTEIAGLTNLDTSDVTSMDRMFDKCNSLTTLNLSNFNTAKVTDMYYMFSDCTSLTSLDLKTFNTKNVDDLRYMFSGCSSLTSLDLSSFEIGGTRMGGMFAGTSLASLVLGDKFRFWFMGHALDLSKPRSLLSTSELQREGKYLTGKWIKKDNQSAAYDTQKFMDNYGKDDLKSGTYVAETKSFLWGEAPYAFDNDTGVLTIKSGTLGQVGSAPWKRDDDKKIDTNKIKKIIFAGETKAPKNADDLFKDLSNLTEFENLTYLDTSETTSMVDTFLNCTSLTTLDLSKFNTKNVTDMRGTFRGCTSLKSLDLSNLNTLNVKGMNKLFENVPLVSLTLGNNFKFIPTDISLSKPRSLFSMSELQREGKYLTGKWIKKDNQSAAYGTQKFMENYGKGDLIAGTYVAEIKASHLWGDAPWSFDEKSGTLEIKSGRLAKSDESPWNRSDDDAIDKQLIKKIIFTGPVLAPKDSTELFRKLTILTEFENLTYLDTSEVTNMDRMFYDCYTLKNLDLSNFNTANVTSIADMFFYCVSLESLDLSKFDTKKMTDMTGLFKSCKRLKTLDLSGFNTANVTTMKDMFNETILSSLTLGDEFRFIGDDSNLPKPTVLNDGDKLTGKWIKKNRGSYPQSPGGFMRQYGKNELTAGTYVAEIEAPLLWGDAPYTFDENTGTLTIESGRLFKSDTSPWKRDDDKKIDGTKIKKIILTGPVLAPEDSTELFNNLTNLTEFENLTYLDTSEVTDMSRMFYDCYGLKELDLSNFNTSNVSSIADMFFYCVSLETLDLSKFDTKKMTDMTGLFKACQKLKTLDLSGFNITNTPTMTDMFKDTILSSLTLGDEFRFVGTDCNLPKPAALTPGEQLTGKWIKQNRGSYAHSPQGFMREYGKNDMTAGTYVAEIKSPFRWGDAPWTFDKNTGTLTIESGQLGQSSESPWNRKDNKKIDAKKIKRIILIGATKATEDASSLFKDLNNLTAFEGLPNLDTSDVTDMNNMFSGCQSLKNLDLSGFRTKKVTNMNNMLANCKALETLDISGFYTWFDVSGNKPNMIDMFSGTSPYSVKFGTHFEFPSSIDATKFSLSPPNEKLKEEGLYPTGLITEKNGKWAPSTLQQFFMSHLYKSIPAGTYMIETVPIKWGDAQCSYDPDSRTLTVNSGNLYGDGPWSTTRGPLNGWTMQDLKKIVFTGENKLMNSEYNSQYTFTYLSKLEEIIGLENVDVSDLTKYRNMFEGCSSLKSLNLSNFDNTGFATSDDPLYRMLLGCDSLSSITLGDNFSFSTTYGNAYLPNPKALNNGDKLTGNWIRKDGQSKAYSPTDFMANYGKGDLQAGTYVGELISSGAILETNISFSTDSGKTDATTAVIGDQLQATLTVKHSETSPIDTTANDIKLSAISLLTDAWTLTPIVTVTTFDQTGKQIASNEQTIKNNELSLPTVPFGSYVEITLRGTAWEKAYAIPGGNYNYTLSYKNQSGDNKVKKSGNFVINSGAFGFKSVPNISFKDNILPIESNQIIDRKNADYAISVTDYRGTRLPDGETEKPDRVNWEITATASPFKDTAGKEIKLSTMAVSFTKAIGQTTELGADATLITSHDVTGETAKQHNLTKLSWAKELGFKVVVHNRTDLDTTNYTADVAFDLRTAP